MARAAANKGTLSSRIFERSLTLEGVTALNDSKQNHDDGYNQQQMDQASDSVGRDHAEEP